MRISEDDLQGDEIRSFLAEHLEEMHAVTPPGSVHALDLSGLMQPSITFWVGTENQEIVVCGALKVLDSDSGEIKSMRTAYSSRGKGVGSQMLEFIIDQARKRGLSRLYLETGAFEAFEPARSMYRKYGFEFTGPFADYRDDGNSVFMVLNLRSGPGVR